MQLPLKLEPLKLRVAYASHRLPTHVLVKALAASENHYGSRKLHPPLLLGISSSAHRVGGLEKRSSSRKPLI